MCSAHANPPGHPENKRIVSRLTGHLPTCSDAAHKVTLSESIRNNSKIQDELQSKINFQARELDDVREQLVKKEEDAQKRAKEVDALPPPLHFLPAPSPHE